MPLSPVSAPPADLDAARRALADTFGFGQFRSGQEEVIGTLLSGRDTLVIMPTGGGKSLCYQLPACITPGVTLVISPLIALMKDQVDALTVKGIAAAAINSSINFDQVREVLNQVRDGGIRLLYVAPERFYSRYFMDAMAQVPVARVAVDEAHCISQWGHDFRPAYLRLPEAIERLGRPPVVALTATATPRVQDDIVQALSLRDPARFVTGFDRDNLTLEVIRCGRKKDALETFAQAHHGSGIVYCATRKRVEEVSAHLAAAGRRVVAYHAGMEDSARTHAQEAFLGDEVEVIVATNAFGMGVDKPDVRFVLHYDMPGTLEAYYQEAGRAGRDGKPSHCSLFYNGGDRPTQTFFIDGTHPTEDFIRTLWRVLCDAAHGDHVELPYREMVERIGLPGSEQTVSAALKVLEQAEALTRLNPRTNPATIRLVDRNQVGERAQVQQKILAMLDYYLPPGENGTVHLPTLQMAEEAGLDHEALLRALHAMDAAGAIAYTAPFRGRGLRLHTPALPEIDFAAVDAKRSAAFEALDAMEGYCIRPGCRRRAILAHFGETASPECGACDQCLSGNSALAGEPEEATEMARKLLSGVARCRIPGSGVSFGLQTIANHLAGGNTESIRRNRLDQVSTYGLLKHYNQRQVAELLEQLITQGLIRREDATSGPNRRPVLALSEAGVAVLKGQAGDIRLHLPQQAATASSRATPAAHAGPVDDDLLSALRALRRELAEADDMPAYRVFSNRTLEEMAAAKPTNPQEMEQVHGVGPSKLATYGERFLAAIKGHEPKQMEADG